MRVPTDKRFNRLMELQRTLRASWPTIARAIANTEQELAELERLLLPSDGRPLAENVSLVLFGSLARGECTARSDLDWKLLINGEVDGRHSSIDQTIRRKLRAAAKIWPSATGTFGGLAFSHDIVHCIGGQDDSNKNLTLRMLLLLESLSIGDDEPRMMVIRAILSRYLADDPSWTWTERKLPRFLLNAAIRFWRTMAVDFADKFHDQEGEKWALRNAKLRFSRKLILLTGMFACFSWRLHGPDSSSTRETEQTIASAITYFEKYFSRPPLEILADEMLTLEAPPEICDAVFTAYDQFLGILDRTEARDELEGVPRELADRSPEFQRIRELSHQFRDGLLNWLYMPDTPLYRLVREYALF